MKSVWLVAVAALSLGAVEPKTVDRYGQFTGEEWPGKITGDAQLRQEAEVEARELSAAAGVRNQDRFGGVLEGKALNATGFFRVEKIDGRWWLITPEGNRFYLKGVDAVPYNERGYFTVIRQADGTPRPVFPEGVPERSEFPEAWNPAGDQVNFMTANLRRKYGAEFHQRWWEVTEKRLQTWGFNSSGKWNNPFRFDTMPYFLDNGINSRRIGYYLDPFDPGFAAAVEQTVKNSVLPRRDDPMVIGIQFENENGWSFDTIRRILDDRSGTLAAKRELLRFLAERHGDAGASFGLGGAPLESLMKQSLPTDRIALSDCSDFVLAASRQYHRTLRDSLRRHDRNHLFFAASHCDAQSPEWIAGAAEFVDVLALHEYNLHSGWIGGELAASLKQWGKPFAVLEYSFTNVRRGFGAYYSPTIVVSEADRGKAFRIYTERLAANPLCVGSSYFILADQPITSRGHDAEAFNFGLVNVTDQPYREMLPEVKAANQRLFDIHDGKLAPVPEQPKLTRATVLSEFMPASTTTAKFDSTNPQFHSGRLERARFNFTHFSGKSNVRQMGILDAGKAGGFGKVEFYVFLWAEAKEQDPQKWFTLEQSPDNLTYTPVEARFQLSRTNKFLEYKLTPVKLAADTRYLKLNFVLHDFSAPWATSLAEVVVERK